ncbi:MAG TPA: polyphosphate kinase 2 family protein, partial [Candidatus Krumholzibacteria bacterium]
EGAATAGHTVSSHRRQAVSPRRREPGRYARVKSKAQACEYLRHGVEALSDLQEKLYARNQWSVLLVFQAIDAAGKDGAIAHVMSGINPQGCQVYSFKSPSSEELDHDFLWRTTKALPERGRIGIFNRSYYEEVLVVRVHPEFLAAQKLPPRLGTKSIWKQRFESINDFEQHLVRNGTVVVKFFLHVSKREQKRRLLQRLDRPEKNWKFSMADVQEREYWNDYMRAYEDMIRHTAAEHAPWYVVPADNKWFTRLVVAWAIHGAMSRLRLAFPEVDVEKQRELSAVRRALRAQSTGKGSSKRSRKRGVGRSSGPATDRRRPPALASGPALS